jgi:hypothetical protein
MPYMANEVARVHVDSGLMVRIKSKIILNINELWRYDKKYFRFLYFLTLHSPTFASPKGRPGWRLIINDPV